MLRILKKKRGKAGFTLIELMLTITIIGIISIITFAIISSAMNTFHKQQDIVDALGMKDQMCLIMKGHLRKRTKMTLLNENLANSAGYVAGGTTDIRFGNVSITTADGSTTSTLYQDEYGYYVLDDRLKEMHLIYAEGGRLYFVESNPEGKYYVATLYAQGTLSALPISTRKEDYPQGTKIAELDGKYGAIPYMAEEQYHGYYVKVFFKPIYTSIQERYRDLKVLVTIYDDASMTDEHQVSYGSETFHLLNIENRQTAIKFLNDTATQQAEPDRTTPEENGFKYCFYD